MKPTSELPGETEYNVDEKIWIWSEIERCWAVVSMGCAISFCKCWPEKYTFFCEYGDIAPPHENFSHP